MGGETPPACLRQSKRFGIEPMFVEPGVKTGIAIQVDNPQEKHVNIKQVLFWADTWASLKRIGSALVTDLPVPPSGLDQMKTDYAADPRAFTTEELKGGWRLACRSIVQEDLTIEVPPLRKRKEDIPALVEHFPSYDHMLPVARQRRGVSDLRVAVKLVRGAREIGAIQARDALRVRDGSMADEGIVRNLAQAPWPYGPGDAETFLMRERRPGTVRRG